MIRTIPGALNVAYTTIGLAVACVLPMIASAGVYKWVDESGNVNYSDRPVEQAEDVHFPGLLPSGAAADSVTEAAAESQAEPPDEEQSGESSGSYSLFQVLEPEENQTFRSDQGEVSISLLLEPTLDAGHEIRLSLDGNPIEGRFTSTQLIIRQVTRGTHSLQASIVDRDGATVSSSNSVSFHVRRASTRPKFEQQ